jgi:hypothetical protein
MGDKLLISPHYFRTTDNPTVERLGRSFFREDVGYGTTETPTGELRHVFGRIHLFDLQGLAAVILETSFFDDPVGLIDDDRAPKIIEDSLEYALRAFPGAPLSVYKHS